MSYLRDNEVRGWCQPVINTSKLNRAQLGRLQEIQLSIPEWTNLSLQLDQVDIPKWLAVGTTNDTTPKLTVNTDPMEVADLMSPFAHDLSGGLLGELPALSFDDSVESDESGFSPEDLDAAEVAAYVGKFRSNFHSLKKKWIKAFVEVESGYGLVVQDLQKLQRALMICHQNIGNKTSSDGGVNPSLWSSVVELQSTVVMVSTSLTGQNSQLGEIENQQESLAQVVAALEDSSEQLSASLTPRVLTIERDLRATEQHLLKLLPLLNQIKQGRGSSPSENSAGIRQSLNDLGVRLQDLQSLVYDQIINATPPHVPPSPIATTQSAFIPPSPTATPHSDGSSSEVMSQLQALQAEMKQLQLKVVGKGVQVANRTFQSFEEVKTWVTTHLPN